MRGSILILEIINCLKKIVKKKRIKGIHEPFFIGNEKKYLINCIDSNTVASVGSYLLKFESRIKKITKTKYVVPVINGTSALHMALIGAGVQSGDEVLMPSLNYIASANATLYCGAIPHFVESEEITLCVDPNKLENYLKLISKKVGKKLINIKTKRIIKSLICLHVFGHPAQINKIKDICNHYNIILIEDAAEALGSYYRNKHVGTFGEIGILSFNGNKIVTTGAGGAILTSNKRIYNKLNHLSKTAKIPHPYLFNYDHLGYNYRIANINAALGLAQLEKLSFFVKKKRQLFLRYKKIFSKIKKVRIFQEPINCRSNYWLQVLLLDKAFSNLKNIIIKKTNKKHMPTRPLWNLLHTIQYLKKFPRMKLEVSEGLYKRIINLPSSANL